MLTAKLKATDSKLGIALLSSYAQAWLKIKTDVAGQALVANVNLKANAKGIEIPKTDLGMSSKAMSRGPEVLQAFQSRLLTRGPGQGMEKQMVDELKQIRKQSQEAIVASKKETEFLRQIINRPGFALKVIH